MILNSNYYLNPDVVQVARSLIGKELVTVIDGKQSSGIITETEAYAGETDRGSHAFGGKRTKRTEVMYMPGGIAYVYLIYGMYSLFNVVTNVEGVPHAVLIRGVIAKQGKDFIAERLKKDRLTLKMTDGPGKLSRALGIHYSDTTLPLRANYVQERQIWIEDSGIVVPDSEIVVGPRIGIDYAGEDANRPYRFLWNVNMESSNQF